MIRDFTIQVLQYISLFNTQVFVIHLCSSITFKICYMFPLVFFFICKMVDDMSDSIRKL